MKKRPVLLLVFLTAFIDMMGFSIIFPLFPQMLEHYLALEGPDSLIGALIRTLHGFAGQSDNADFLVMVLFGGVLGSLFSVLQFLFAPFWGSLSDRIGRRPTLLVTLLGTALGYALWIVAGQFWLLIVSRLIGGMMAGNLSTVSAVVADTTTSKDRSKGMGLMGAGIGLGFIVGPAIGGLSSFIDLRLWWSGSADWGVNPFSAAALAAAVLSFANFALALATFPETNDSLGKKTVTRSANPIALFVAVSQPGVQAVNLINLFFLSAFSAMEFSLTFVALERFAFTPRENAQMFVFVGLVLAMVQGGVVRRLGPKYGDRKLALWGLAITAPGLAIIGIASTVTVLYVGLFGLAVGSALATPALSALISKYAPSDQQGLAMGTFRSVGALSRAIGPLAGGLYFWQFGGRSAYTAAAILMCLPALLVFKLPPVPNE